MKMDKSGPKNNNFGKPYLKKFLTTISVGFRYFPKLSRYLYDHKAIKLAASIVNLKSNNFYVFLFSYFIGQILPRTILTTEYVVKNVVVFKAVSPSCFRDQCFPFFHRKKSTQNQPKTSQNLESNTQL